jgi:cell wall assembly regulator SMI1
MTFAAYLRAIGKIYGDVDRRLVLSSPAREAELRDLEATFRAKPPLALRSAWLSANGGKAGTPLFARPGFLTGYDFLSVAGARREQIGLQKRSRQYKDYVEPRPRDARIRPGWFEPGWLPFADFGGATLLLMVDMSPTAKGSKGQVIAFTHDPDRISWTSKSFSDFLAASLKAFKADREELLLT